MKRVVITGLGIVSCLGNDAETVTQSLKEGKSGITFNEKYKEMGLRSQVCGRPDIDITEHIDRKVRRFMGDAAAYAYISMNSVSGRNNITVQTWGKKTFALMHGVSQ